MGSPGIKESKLSSAIRRQRRPGDKLRGESVPRRKGGEGPDSKCFSNAPNLFLVGLAAKDEGRLRGRGKSSRRFCAVWTRPSPAGVFENVFKPKKADIILSAYLFMWEFGWESSLVVARRAPLVVALLALVFFLTA